LDLSAKKSNFNGKVTHRNAGRSNIQGGEITIPIQKKRTRLPWDKGGLSFFNIEARSLAFKCSLVIRLSNSVTSKTGKFVSSFWKTSSPKRTDETADCPPLMKSIIQMIIPLMESTELVEMFKKEDYDIPKLTRLIQDYLDPEWSKVTLTPRQAKFEKFNPNQCISTARKMNERNLAEFMWKFFQGAIPFNHNTTCPRCNKTKLSYNHIFFDCVDEEIYQDYHRIRALLTPNNTRWKTLTQEDVWKAFSTGKHTVYQYIIAATLKTIWRIFLNKTQASITYWVERAGQARLTHVRSKHIMNDDKLQSKRKQRIINTQKQWKTDELWTKHNKLYHLQVNKLFSNKPSKLQLL